MQCVIPVFFSGVRMLDDIETVEFFGKRKFSVNNWAKFFDAFNFQLYFSFFFLKRLCRKKNCALFILLGNIFGFWDVFCWYTFHCPPLRDVFQNQYFFLGGQHAIILMSTYLYFFPPEKMAGWSIKSLTCAFYNISPVFFLVSFFRDDMYLRFKGRDKKKKKTLKRTESA